MALDEMHNPMPTTTVEGERGPRATTIWLWLTGPIAVLAAIAAGAGVFFEDLYRDAPVNAEGACAFPLHSDDAKGPYAFRIDLSRFGISTVRVVFSRELGVGTTRFRTDFVPLWV
jgi:hypothetical protein